MEQLAATVRQTADHASQAERISLTFPVLNAAELEIKGIEFEGSAIVARPSVPNETSGVRLKST